MRPTLIQFLSLQYGVMCVTAGLACGEPLTTDNAGSEGTGPMVEGVSTQDTRGEEEASGSSNGAQDTSDTGDTTGQDNDPNDTTPLGRCLALGGALSEVDSFDNNIAMDHGGITNLALSESGQVAIASTDGAIKLWTVAGEPGASPNVGYDSAFGAGGPVIEALTYVPGTPYLVAGSALGVVSIWDLATQQTVDSFTMGEAAVSAVASSDDASRVATANEFGDVVVWSQSDGSVSDPLPSALWATNVVAFVPGSGALVTAGHEYGTGMIELRDPDDPATVVGWWRGQNSDTGPVYDIAMTSDQQHLVAGGDGFVLVIQLANLPGVESAAAVVRPQPEPFISVALSPDEELFVGAAADGTLRMWGTSTGYEIDSARSTLSGVVALRTEPGSDVFVAADNNGVVHLLGCTES